MTHMRLLGPETFCRIWDQLRDELVIERLDYEVALLTQIGNSGGWFGFGLHPQTEC